MIDIAEVAELLRDMILNTDGATGIDLVDQLEQAAEDEYQRGYDNGRTDVQDEQDELAAQDEQNE